MTLNCVHRIYLVLVFTFVSNLQSMEITIASTTPGLHKLAHQPIVVAPLNTCDVHGNYQYVLLKKVICTPYYERVRECSFTHEELTRVPLMQCADGKLVTLRFGTLSLPATTCSYSSYSKMQSYIVDSRSLLQVKGGTVACMSALSIWALYWYCCSTL